MPRGLDTPHSGQFACVGAGSAIPGAGQAADLRVRARLLQHTLPHGLSLIERSGVDLYFVLLSYLIPGGCCGPATAGLLFSVLHPPVAADLPRPPGPELQCTSGSGSPVESCRVIRQARRVKIQLNRSATAEYHLASVAVRGRGLGVCTVHAGPPSAPQASTRG